MVDYKRGNYVVVSVRNVRGNFVNRYGIVRQQLGTIIIYETKEGKFAGGSSDRNLRKANFLERIFQKDFFPETK